MPQTGKIFRIFVSSPFSDLKEERNVLQDEVFPKLRELCMAHGCRFQAIDLRWGISEEAALDQQTLTICLKEIERCQKVTPRPNFIILLGDRYGWRPLPPTIEDIEFESLLEELHEQDKARISKWYWRDDNAVPPEYVLQPRTGQFVDSERWAKEEAELLALLRKAAEQVLEPDSERAVKYVASATHQEILRGALSVTDAQAHVFGFFRNFKTLPSGSLASEFIDIDGNGALDKDEHCQQQNLKDNLRSVLKGHIHEYDVEWKESGPSHDHLRQLCKDVYESLSTVIMDEIAQIEEQDELNQEIDNHLGFGAERSRHFIGRTFDLKAIEDYLSQQNPYPFAVWGDSGSGKTALMAKAVEQARKAYPHASVVGRFIGATPESSNGRALLNGLCHEIARKYGADESDIPLEFCDLVQHFPKMLTLATQDRPLIVFLDALDQLSDSDNAHNLVWLPTQLPEHARLIVSTLPGLRCNENTDTAVDSINDVLGKGEILGTLNSRLPEETLHMLQPMLPEEGANLFDQWMNEVSRTLQSEQREVLLRRFAENGLPLYLKLAFEEARLWKSYHPAPDFPANIPGIIRHLFARLSLDENHGAILVSRSLGYLAAGKNGLTEDELLDVLSADDEVIQDFQRRAPKSPEVKCLPIVVWSRLSLDLAQYLTERQADGTLLLFFYHRQLAEVTIMNYMSNGNGKARHSTLARYFHNQPLSIENAGKQTFDRRKIAELPYQQTTGAFAKDLAATLTDFSFLQAKVVMCGPKLLLEDFERAVVSGILEDMESIRFIGEALRLSNHILARDPYQLASQLVGRLHGVKNEQVKKMLINIRSKCSYPWLCLYSETLTPPFDSFRQVFQISDTVCNSLVVTNDEQFLIVGVNGGITIILQADTLEKIYEYKPSDLDPRYSGSTLVTVTPDSNILLSSYLNQVILWNLTSQQQKSILQGHAGGITALAVTPDGKYAIVASYDGGNAWGGFLIWNLKDLTILHSLHCEMPIDSINITSDSKYVMAFSRRGLLDIWEIYGGREKVRSLELLDHNYVILSPDDRYLISCLKSKGYEYPSSAPQIVIWDIENGQQIRVLGGHSDQITAIAITFDLKIISTSLDGTLRIWDFITGRCLHAAQLFVSTPKFLIASSSSDTFFTSSTGYDGDIAIQKWTTGTILTHEIEPIRSYPISVTTFSPDGTYAASSDGTTISIWRVSDAKKCFTLNGRFSSVRALAFLPDNKHIISAHISEKTAFVWNIESNKQVCAFNGHSSNIIFLSVSSDGQVATSASENGEVFSWKIQDANEISKTSGISLFVDYLSFSVNKSLLVTAGGESKIGYPKQLNSEITKAMLANSEIPIIIIPCGNSRFSCFFPGFVMDDPKQISVWDLKTGKELAVLIGHTNKITGLCFSPNGAYLCSTSLDYTIRVWDVNELKQITIFTVDSPLVACAISADGFTILAGDKAGNVHFFNLRNYSLEGASIN